MAATKKTTEQKPDAEPYVARWGEVVEVEIVGNFVVRDHLNRNRILRTGDRVTHSQFGDGIVVSCKDVSDDHEVVVAFDGLGVKRLLMSFAHLEKVG